MFRLDQKHAVITGGAKGIGRAIATLFARQGARVSLLDIDTGQGNALAAALKEEVLQAVYLPCDQASLEAVQAAAEALPQAWGPPDILVNNAAVSHIGTAESTTPEDMERLLKINIQGVYHMLHVFLPLMKVRGGAILNMASVAANVGLSERFAYSATKGAIATMTLSVAKDYLPFGIRCNSVSPARVHTPFVEDYLKQHYPGREAEMFKALSATQPIGRMARPEEIAALALYLCSDEAGFVTGTDFPIDGGFKTLNT